MSGDHDEKGREEGRGTWQDICKGKPLLSGLPPVRRPRTPHRTPEGGKKGRAVATTNDGSEQTSVEAWARTAVR